MCAHCLAYHYQTESMCKITDAAVLAAMHRTESVEPWDAALDIAAASFALSPAPKCGVTISLACLHALSVMQK